MSRTLTGADIRVGEALPEVERKIDLADMVAYGAATWDWHRMHYDRAFAAELGFPAPVVDGQMLGALLAKQLTDWFGPRAFIRKMSFRFRAMVFAGEAVRCVGEVSRITPISTGVAVEVTQRILVGDRAAVDPASAEVILPS